MPNNSDDDMSVSQHHPPPRDAPQTTQVHAPKPHKRTTSFTNLDLMIASSNSKDTRSTETWVNEQRDLLSARRTPDNSPASTASLMASSIQAGNQPSYAGVVTKPVAPNGHDATLGRSRTIITPTTILNRNRNTSADAHTSPPRPKANPFTKIAPIRNPAPTGTIPTATAIPPQPSALATETTQVPRPKPLVPSTTTADIIITPLLRSHFATPGVPFPPLFSPLGRALRTDAKFLQMKDDAQARKNLEKRKEKELLKVMAAAEKTGEGDEDQGGAIAAPKEVGGGAKTSWVRLGRRSRVEPGMERRRRGDGLVGGNRGQPDGK